MHNFFNSCVKFVLFIVFTNSFCENSKVVSDNHYDNNLYSLVPRLPDLFNTCEKRSGRLRTRLIITNSSNNHPPVKFFKWSARALSCLSSEILVHSDSSCSQCAVVGFSLSSLMPPGLSFSAVTLCNKLPNVSAKSAFSITATLSSE